MHMVSPYRSTSNRGSKQAKARLMAIAGDTEAKSMFVSHDSVSIL
jgi:hypothetical protein